MAELSENALKVLDAVKAGIKSRGDLRQTTGLHYSAINDALYELEASGQVEKVETTLKDFYRIAGSGEQPPAPGAGAPEPPATSKAARREPRQAAQKRSAKKGGRKGAAKKAGRSGRKPAPAAPPTAETANVSPPPFSQNGFATAMRAAALEFEYQAFWKEPSPKAETVKSMVAEAAARLRRE